MTPKPCPAQVRTPVVIADPAIPEQHFKPPTEHFWMEEARPFELDFEPIREEREAA